MLVPLSLKNTVPSAKSTSQAADAWRLSKLVDDQEPLVPVGPKTGSIQVEGKWHRFGASRIVCNSTMVGRRQSLNPANPVTVRPSLLDSFNAGIKLSLVSNQV